MEDYKQECIHKSITINKYRKKITELELTISSLRKENKYHINLKQEIENRFTPIQDSLNKMTSEHGKLLRRIKREKNKFKSGVK